MNNYTLAHLKATSGDLSTRYVVADEAQAYVDEAQRLRDRLAEALDALRTTRDQVAQLGHLQERSARVDRLIEDLGRERAAFAAFKDQVRELAIDKAAELGWCTPGLNDALRELGLDPKVTRWDVAVDVTLTGTVTVTVEADTEDDALDQVNGWSHYSLASELSDMGEGIPDGWDVHEFTAEGAEGVED